MHMNTTIPSLREWVHMVIDESHKETESFKGFEIGPTSMYIFVKACIKADLPRGSC